jgi:EAL domain-containing protein (putative c-di-GMP-specific phosphodiesterase class I)/GGDEF domain-containing protein
MTTIGGEKGLRSGPVLMRREMVAFLPAIGLAGLWFGLEGMALVAVTALIVGWMTRPIALPQTEEDTIPDVPPVALPVRDEAVQAMDALLEEASTRRRSTACLVIGYDSAPSLKRDLAPHEFEDLLELSRDRITDILREGDHVLRIGQTRFAVLLKPTRNQNLESLIQLSGRLQAELENPFSISQRTIAVTMHIGFCLMTRAPQAGGDALLSAAEQAADEAERNGPGAIRAYSSEIRSTTRARSELTQEIGAALESGKIIPFFQPQLCTDTGQISGVQALPRWLHPSRGILTERDILPAVDAAGLRTRFSEVMLFECFDALRQWQQAGETFAPVSLPISIETMVNPKLSERLKWELDRFSIAPEMLCLILQQNVLGQLNEEVVVQNLRACAQLGCQIELAGFGNGPASIANIRRSGAHRLRIHRSFVTHVDQDAEQQRLVAALIAMADGLGLTTLAEGVQTIGEHAILAQLGCHHVQGRAISAPMPLEETFEWAARHRTKLEATPRLSRRS